MFCDLVGSTALSERLDPEDLRALMAAYRKAIGEVIDRYDGHVAQYLGDGVMAYFGWPRAHEDDAERSVRSALAIVEAVKQVTAPAPLEVRLGMATGPVVVGEGADDDAQANKLAVGETPNIAARLQALAGPDQIVIGPGTHRLVGGAFEYRDLGECDLKGILQPVRAWQVTGASQAVGRFEARAVGGLTPFVGRETEIQMLLDRWRQAEDGEGQVVLLSGEPGIGKSRVTQVLRERVADEPHVRLRYQCSPFYTNSAFYPIIGQLERAAGFARDDTADHKLDKLETLLAQGTEDVAKVAPLLAAMLSLPVERYPPLNLSPQRQKDDTIAALAAQVTGLAEHQPLLMLFEDAHWCDPTTLQVLSAVIGWIEAAPVLLVITYRPEFDPPWTGHGHVVVQGLSRLGKRQGADMVAKVTGGKALPDEVLDQIVAKTDGVPLFVEELTKTVLEGGLLEERDGAYHLDGPLPPLAIPTTLRDSLMERLDRLATVKEVAQIGACIGREFGFDLLAAVSPLADDELQDALGELVTSDLVFQRGTAPDATYTFKHALVQDTAYESLLKSRRQQFHTSIAEALETRFPDTVANEPEVLAHHYTRAGLAKVAIGYWLKAGERAADHFAHEEAVNHYNNGLDIIASVTNAAEPASRELTLLLGLVASFRILGRYEQSLDALDRAEALAVRDDQTLVLANIHYLRGNIYFPRGDIDGCRKEHEIALRLAMEAGSAEYEARSLSGLGDADYLQGRMVGAFANYDRCIEICQSQGFAGIEVANLHMRGLTRYYQSDLIGGLEDCITGAEGAARAGKHREESLSHGSAGNILWEMGQFEAARSRSEAALKLARRLGSRILELYQLIFLALDLMSEDHRAEAVQLACKAVEISCATEAGPSQVGPWALGAVAATSNDREQRRQALEEGERLLGPDCVSHCHLWFYRLAMDASLKCADWEGLEHYASALEAFTKIEPLPWSDFFIARARILVAHERNKHDEATRQGLERLRKQAERARFVVAKRALDQALNSS